MSQKDNKINFEPQNSDNINRDTNNSATKKEKPVSKTGRFFGRLLFFVVFLAIVAGTVLLTDYVIKLITK